jgi:hypothetical protein
MSQVRKIGIMSADAPRAACVLCHLPTDNQSDLFYFDGLRLRLPLCDECHTNLGQAQDFQAELTQADRWQRELAELFGAVAADGSKSTACYEAALSLIACNERERLADRLREILQTLEKEEHDRPARLPPGDPGAA